MAEQPASLSPNWSPLGHSTSPIINKLQDILAQIKSHSAIDLPQVAVIGSQGSGKSSVLEALVGRDFLLRGSSICTRCPLVLQLLQTKRRADGMDEEYGEFLHLPGKRFYDFSEIRKEIQAETDREAGGNKGVSDRQIRLNIISPNVLDITLVDLPGLTKVPVGDQPSDVGARIQTMIMSYIEAPSCLILAVLAANANLTTSDALQMARMADPDGLRTIGVITKLDIMDRGTDARDLLLGKVIPLRLGYVGVVNRSQEDIVLNRSVKDALVAEEKFFSGHPVYNDLADRCGIPQLAKKLNQILVQHIKAVLPGLKSHIGSEAVSVAKEHASCGVITESKAAQGALLLKLLWKYSEAFSSMLEGKKTGLSSSSEISGGARIHYIFQSIFVKALEEVDPCEGLTDDDIRTAIQNASSVKAALFVPEGLLKVLVQRQIARLLDPSLQCARLIHDELMKISHRCMVNELQRFPGLRKQMDEVLGNFLGEGLERSETLIRHIIDIEVDCVNASHPDFIGGSEAEEIALQEIKASSLPSPMSGQKDAVELDTAPSSAEEISTNKPPATEPVQTMGQASSMKRFSEPPTVLRPSESLPEPDATEIAVMKKLIVSYYGIIRKKIEDTVPKAIMHFMVNHTKRELHHAFVKNLYREGPAKELLQELDEVAAKGERTRETLRVLQQAYRALGELLLEAETVEGLGGS